MEVMLRGGLRLSSKRWAADLPKNDPATVDRRSDGKGESRKAEKCGAQIFRALILQLRGGVGKRFAQAAQGRAAQLDRCGEAAQGDACAAGRADLDGFDALHVDHERTVEPEERGRGQGFGETAEGPADEKRRPAFGSDAGEVAIGLEENEIAGRSDHGAPGSAEANAVGIAVDRLDRALSERVAQPGDGRGQPVGPHGFE